MSITSEISVFNTFLNIKSLINHYRYSIKDTTIDTSTLNSVIKLIDDVTTSSFPTEEAAYNEVANTAPAIPEGALSRWWFNQGYQHTGKIKAEVWHGAIVDELICLHIYNESHDSNPKKALTDIIVYNVDIALDPQVSSSAQALIDRGYALGLEAGIAQGIQQGIQQGKDISAKELLTNSNN